MNPTFFTRISLSLLLFAAALGLFFNYYDSQAIEPTKQCNIDHTKVCIAQNNGQQISVQFLQEIELEEELVLNIIIPNHITIEQMWVQGINMYMGKTAILTDSISAQNEQKIYHSHLFLGACSEPKMRWQLIIRTRDESQAEQSWYFNFSTDRNKKAK